MLNKVIFKGPAGNIEGKFIRAEDEHAPVALVLHPHPQYGGTMDNKVVYNLYRTLYNNGFSVLRINFRGVGNSTGEYDGGVGELTDAATALDWLNDQCPTNKFTLIAGFSFGAWIAMQLIMRRPEITHFITVSPPVNNQDFSFLSPCPISGLIIQGNRDSVVPESAVGDLADRLVKQKNTSIQYKVIDGADHFFRDKINELNDEITDHLEKLLKAEQNNKPANHQSSAKVNNNTKQIFLD